MVQIGQHLLRELGLEQSNDTLARWMAHRIAELMERADKGRTAALREGAKSACSDLILRLWEKRAHLPSGAPLASFADFLQHFVEQEPSWFAAIHVTPERKSWPQSLPVVKHLLEHELTLWREAALAAQPHDKARSLVRKLDTELDPEEARILRSLADAGPRYGRMLAHMFGDSPDKQPLLSTDIEREAAFRKAIANVALQRMTLLESVVKRPRRNVRKRATKRKPR